MFGLDDWIAGLSDSGSVLVVVLVATLLGLRHATDPDHIAAVTTLVASGRDRAARSAARLGAWWGLGHAVTLVAFGLPILLAERYLPERAQQGAETAVAALIVFLAIRLLLRWRHGVFSTVPGGRGGDDHRHGVRTPLGAFGIGLVHGMGGSAGVGVLLLAAIPDSDRRDRGAARSRAVHGRLDDPRHVRLRRHAHHPERRAVGVRRRAGARRREPRVRGLVRRSRLEPRAVPLLEDEPTHA